MRTSLCQLKYLNKWYSLSFISVVLEEGLVITVLYFEV